MSSSKEISKIEFGRYHYMTLAEILALTKDKDPSEVVLEIESYVYDEHDDYGGTYANIESTLTIKCLKK